MRDFIVKRGAAFVHHCASRNDIMETSREYEAMKIKGWNEAEARATLKRDFGVDEANRMDLVEV